ncbi:MAG: hypothetical protein J2P54_25785 [Bradyrhizobiaceae bacterium]|nr:hypothetical protein [Bradyrhizobiaceae bacterium]
MKRTIALGLIITVAMALGSSAVSAQPFGHRHHHYYYHGGGFGHPTREGLVRTPGN